ncbi:MAG: helix-turn-helix domain-containing protein [Lachnospiraceae bacterium]|nr:helix-turn-helix domain-containing protein [Lachnospiraceae bacterium]
MEQNSNILPELVNNLDILMKKNGISANDFAKAIGKRRAIVTDWRSGRSSPSLDTIVLICNTFNCSLYEIFPAQFFTNSDKTVHFSDPINENIMKILPSLPENEREDILELIEFKIYKQNKKERPVPKSSDSKDDKLA